MDLPTYLPEGKGKERKESVERKESAERKESVERKGKGRECVLFEDRTGLLWTGLYWI